MNSNGETVTITKKNFWHQAWKFVEKNFPTPRNELFTIKPGTNNWRAWREYFERHLLWQPAQLKVVIDDRSGLKTMTVPSEWPEHFDPSFRVNPDWKEPTPKVIPERKNRETLEQLKKRIGPNWSLNNQIPSGRFTLAERREAQATLDAMAADIRERKLERAKDIGAQADAMMRKTWDDFDREFGT